MLPPLPEKLSQSEEQQQPTASTSGSNAASASEALAKQENGSSGTGNDTDKEQNGKVGLPYSFIIFPGICDCWAHADRDCSVFCHLFSFLNTTGQEQASSESRFQRT
jgi:hypothetical protein